MHLFLSSSLLYTLERHSCGHQLPETFLFSSFPLSLALSSGMIDDHPLFSFASSRKRNPDMAQISYHIGWTSSFLDLALATG